MTIIRLRFQQYAFRITCQTPLGFVANLRSYHQSSIISIIKNNIIMSQNINLYQGFVTNPRIHKPKHEYQQLSQHTRIYISKIPYPSINHQCKHQYIEIRYITIFIWLGFQSYREIYAQGFIPMILLWLLQGFLFLNLNSPNPKYLWFHYITQTLIANPKEPWFYHKIIKTLNFKSIGFLYFINNPQVDQGFSINIDIPLKTRCQGFTMNPKGQGLTKVSKRQGIIRVDSIRRLIAQTRILKIQNPRHNDVSNVKQS